jgi:ribosomal protein L37AE/L43A
MNTEPIPDLVNGGPDGPICPHCGAPADARSGPDIASWYWRCDHCRISWAPDGTGGEQP